MAGSCERCEQRQVPRMACMISRYLVNQSKCTMHSRSHSVRHRNVPCPLSLAPQTLGGFCMERGCIPKATMTGFDNSTFRRSMNGKKMDGINTTEVTGPSENGTQTTQRGIQHLSTCESTDPPRHDGLPVWRDSHSARGRPPFCSAPSRRHRQLLVGASVALVADHDAGNGPVRGKRGGDA